jgi:hypothetical protein
MKAERLKNSLKLIIKIFIQNVRGRGRGRGRGIILMVKNRP